MKEVKQSTNVNELEEQKILEESLFKYFKKNSKRSYNLNYLFKLFKLDDDSEQQIFLKAIKTLELESKIYFNENNEVCFLETKSDYKVGKIKINKKGQYYISVNSHQIFINSKDLNGAMKDDIVLVKKNDINYELQSSAVVKRIINRTSGEIIFDCIVKNGKLTYESINKDFNYNVILDSEDTKYLVDGDRIKLQISDEYTMDGYKAKLVDNIGNKNDPNIEILTLAAERDIRIGFSKKVMDEVYKIPTEVQEKDLIGREDYRQEEIFTIDDKDTKDMDDAIGLKILPNGNYSLGVHIADVSHYIKFGSTIFNEAFKRGTSRYPANFVIPMIHRILSNGICSLNENVDRLTLSITMEINKNGKVINSNIVPSVINSKKKMNYDDVNQILDKNQIVPGYESFVETLQNMKKLHKILDNNKRKRGYIDFGDNDVKFDRDKDGNTIGIRLLERCTGERMIEDFMLLANEEIAKYIAMMELPFPFRVHEAPSNQLIKETINSFNDLGCKIRCPKNFNNPHAIQDVLRQIKDLTIYPIFSEMILQKMKRAIYTPNNVGHFGLALQYYTHFTSPIRRIIDLIVHMLIKAYRQNVDIKELDKITAFLEETCAHATLEQKKADEFERDIVSLESVKYMANKIGETITGTIYYVSKKSILIKTKENVYGKINTKDLNGEFTLDAKNLSLVSKDKEYKIGEELSVIVKSADVKANKVTFKPVSYLKENEYNGNMVRTKKISF